MKGYLDRFEDNDLAIILIEENNKQFNVPISKLPAGAQPGSWMHLTVENDEIQQIILLEHTTQEKQQQASDLLAKLRAKKNVSRYKK